MVSITAANYVVSLLFVAAAAISVTVAWRYAEAGINRFAFFASCLGFTVGLSTIILVPYDVWSTLGRPEEDIQQEVPLSEAAIQHGWEALYWTTVLVCYLLIPILMEFETAGDFRFDMRLKTALRRNLIWYVIYLVLAVCAFFFLPSQWYAEDGSEHNSVQGVVGFYIALSNTVGLVILTILMGHGLVALPRSLWRSSDKIGQLAKLYADLSAQNVVKQAALARLKEAILQAEREIEPYDVLFKAQNSTDADAIYGTHEDDRHVSEALGILSMAVCRSKELCKGFGVADDMRGITSERNTWSNLSARSTLASGAKSLLIKSDENGGNDPERSIIDRVDKKQSLSALLRDMRDLTKLHTTLKSLNLQARRASHRFQRLTHACLVLEDLDGLVEEEQADSWGSQWSERLQLYAASWSHTRKSWLCCSGCCRRFLRKYYCARMLWRRYLLLWHRTLRPVALKALSCLAGTLSFFIVVAQLTMFSDDFWFCSLFAVLIRSHHGLRATHVICLLPLGYMGYAVAWSVFRMRIFNWYGLYPGHNTDCSSLLWCTTIVTRLSVPLGYHFLFMIHVASTSFEDFMQPMKIIPVLGDAFNRYLPIFIALLALSNTLGVYSRIVQRLGFKVLQFTESSNPDSASDPATEGKELVKLMRRRRFENGVVELRNQAGDTRSFRAESHCLQDMMRAVGPEEMTSDSGTTAVDETSAFDSEPLSDQSDHAPF